MRIFMKISSRSIHSSLERQTAKRGRLRLTMFPLLSSHHHRHRLEEVRRSSFEGCWLDLDDVHIAVSKFTFEFHLRLTLSSNNNAEAPLRRETRINQE